MTDLEWQSGSLCWQRLVEAESKALNPSDAADLEVTARYWCQEFPNLAEKTRSSVVATFTTMIDGVIRGTLRELFCTTTTLTPEDTHYGKVIVVDLPLKEYHEVGRFAQILWKYCWQRVTESRKTTDETRPVFLWVDEAQLFITEHDPQFQATARSARACTVYLSQNIPNYYARMGGTNAKPATDAFLGNLQTKIFHANGDAETNEWAERVVSKVWTQRVSSSSQDQPKDPNNPFANRRSISTSTSPHHESELPARVFTQLRTGGPANKGLVDAVVVKAGRVWKSSGTTFLLTTFRQ